ncbi:benzoate 4-monooxygenase cytochrome P450 [Microthyrium microscopicum]|uniref:Benzoate 4-monooxygenase cytochrome P450 n=1 Tax=Microthyrium microscopicum TaxID=703497 RepID=A0A6A6U6N1_9PEZI|nr:benzoate 4-monooxygenase cytochrome P450 [Microthyrium microscopicum]
MFYLGYLILSLGVGLLLIIRRLFTGSLSKIPGPKLYACTSWRLAYDDWKGTRTRKIERLHAKYGPVVRIGPEEVSFNSLTALKTIYGAGSGFERTSFYDMFDVYGRKNLFTFHSVKSHGDRKKLLAHAYSKSVMLKGYTATLIQQKVHDYLGYIRGQKDCVDEIFSSLHYFALDAITKFLYADWGATACLTGNVNDRKLLNDIMDTSRRRLSWFAVHFPRVTKWLYSRTGLSEVVARQFYPMQKPTTYTGIRQHALDAWKKFQESTKFMAASDTKLSIIERLRDYHTSQMDGGLDDLDLASEAADHLLAGIDTTSDSLMFLVWALARPCNQEYQEKLIREVDQISESDLDENGIPSVEACDKLRYLDAIVKETLRLYAPLPASEPRAYPGLTIIDGYTIPERTVVSMSPFSLHRNGHVFHEPLDFKPERWLTNDRNKLAEMKKWFWAFSSGGRMCIGLHLAMAEMTVLVAALLRNFRVSITPEMDKATPGITSRFEVFHDVQLSQVKEHECWIKFSPRK